MAAAGGQQHGVGGNSSHHALDAAVAFASGLAAGFTTTAVLHPLDLLKTRLQVDESFRRWSWRDGPRALLATDALTTRKVLEQLGFRGLYRGLVPAVAGSSASWALYWASYERLKQAAAGEHKRRLGPGEYLAYSAAAGALTTLCTNPLWLIKTRMELQSPGNEPYRGFLHAAQTIQRQEGWRGFYKGLVPALLLVSNGAIQFVIYEEVKHACEDRALVLGPTDFMLLGALSKCVASVVTYPYQVVKSRLQQHESRYSSTWQTFSEIRHRQGWGALYRGLLPNILKVAPSSAITFATYEQCKVLLHRAAARLSALDD